MRTFTKPDYDWTMSYIELRDICEEVYGVPYDLQMGERGRGEYEIASTDPEAIDDIQGYWKGMGQGYGYDGKYIEGSEWVPFIEGETGAVEAIEKWSSQSKTEWMPGKLDWDRPFSKVGPNGEYTFYQPDLDVVLCDLAVREEIPHGKYMITIDW